MLSVRTWTTGGFETTSVGIWSEWATMRYRLFDWRMNIALRRKLVLCLGMASLTGFLAQIRLPLSFTPVSMTGQVFAVLLAGILLGKHFDRPSSAHSSWDNCLCFFS